MITRRYAAFVLSAGLVGGLLGSPATQAAPNARPAAQPAAIATIAGTPTQLLAALPVTEPLTVGYTGGLFLSPADLRKRDKRGCAYRNQVLLKLAVKKPRIGKKCKLSGGEWRADFGRTVIKKASQVKLGKLLPDKFVYAQGAYGWTPEQRKAYANSTTTVAKATRSSINGLLDENNLQLFSPSGFRFLFRINAALLSDSKQPEVLETELATLKSTSPEFFESWTVASLLNAKSWGLSFSLGVYYSSSKTLRDCTKGEDRLVSLMVRSQKSADPCNDSYSIINQAARFKIVPIPIGSSQTPPISEAVLSGYGTPQGDPIDRFLFGIHAPADWVSDVASGFDGPINPATIPNVPVGFLRLWDTETTWRDLEPSNGQYDWRKLGKQIEMAQILDARVMLVLGGTPAWAGDGSVQSNPRSIDDWRDYVGTVACRYGASISAYEIWNEANLQTFWKGTPAEMAELTKVAFEEIRRCNPSALVVAANTTSRATGSFGTFFPAYLEEMKKRGWPADAYSVHSYPTASGGADDRIKGISQFRSMLALAGAPFTTTFDTEINYGLAGLGEGKVDLTGDDAMTLLSRTYIDSARYGFGSTFWFVWTAKPDSKFGIQLTGASANEQRAWRTTYDWLVGAQYQRCFETPEGVVVCQFNKGPENFSLVWRGDVGSPNATLPAGYLSGFGSRSCDLNGNCDFMTTSTQLTVGPMPVRIDGPPMSSGPSEQPGGDAPDGAVVQPPTVLDVTVVYGPSNKANAFASWTPPSNLIDVRVNGYDYEWRFCASGSCRQVARGSTGPDTLTASTDLPNGPGRYEFAVRARASFYVKTDADPSSWAVSGSGTSSFATSRFNQLTSRAAAPSNVFFAARDVSGVKSAEVAWAKPAIQAGQGPRYEVQARNLTANGEWKTFKLTEGNRLRFPASDINLEFGQVGQARVRTVLANGQTSAFIASNEYTFTQAEPPPTVVAVFNGPNLALYTWVKSGSGSKAGYPSQGFQVRASGDGVNWTMMKYRGPFGVGDAPNAAPNNMMPFDQNVFVGTFLPTFDRAEIRTVFSDDRLPSPWVKFVG